jgi:hypothetical protein
MLTVRREPGSEEFYKRDFRGINLDIENQFSIDIMI